MAGMRLFGILLVAVVVIGLGVWVGVAQLTDSGSANNETSKSVDVVLNDLGKVQNKRVAVEGDVKTSFAPWAVLLGSSDASQTGLLVVARKRVPNGARISAHVTATGIARPFSLTFFHRAHPNVTNAQLRTSPLRELVGQPSLMDATVAITPATG